MDNRHSGSLVRDCAAQLPHRYRRHDQDLARRRVCSHCTDGLDGNLLRWRRLTDTYCYTYCYFDSDAHGHGNCYAHADTNADVVSNGHAHADSYADGHSNSNSNSSSYSHTYGHTNTDGNANCYSDSDGNINPMYGEVFTDTKASANSGAASVVALLRDSPVIGDRW